MSPHPPVPPAPPAPPVAAPPVAAPPGPGPAPVLQTGVNKSSADNCEKRLKQLNVEPGDRIMAQNTPPSQKGVDTPVMTNVFGLELEHDTKIYCYIVDMSTEMRNGKKVVFTLKTNQDYSALSRHEKCMDILSQIMIEQDGFFKASEGNTVVYDGQNLFYTTVDLFPEIEAREKKKKIFQVNGANIDNAELQNLELIQFEIFACEREHIYLTKERLLEYTADSNLEVNDRSLTQFIELVLNQTCARDTKRFSCFKNGKVFCVNPLQEGYDQRDVSRKDGKELKPGFKKSVIHIEGPMGRGNNNPALVFDSMKAEFHVAELVIDKINGITRKNNEVLGRMEMENITQLLKGVTVYSVYTGKTRYLKVEGISHETAEKAKFELPDGKHITVAQYFFEKYNISLKYPRANLLICKERGNKNYFPSELMRIAPNQRVTIQQNVANQGKDVKECAVLPLVRQRLILTGMKAAGLNGTTELMAAFGIKLYNEPLVVNGRQMENNKVIYGDSVQNVERGKWRSGRKVFKNGDAPNCWAVYGIACGNSRFNQGDVQNFAKQFHEIAASKGVHFPHPTEMQLIGQDSVEDVYTNAAKHGCEFILTITDDTIKGMHNYLKMLERKLEMVIQDVRMSNAGKVIRDGKRLTLENIFSKTNVKLGGLNYAVESKFITDDQLIIGIGQTVGGIPFTEKEGDSSSQNPTILGYASNAVNKQEFYGDSVYTAFSPHTFSAVEEILKATIADFKEARKIIPKRIMVYRTASSEGSFGSILAFEVPLAKETLKLLGAEDAKLTYIVVNKEHFVRLFNLSANPGDKAMDANIRPGIAVDKELTHPSFKQFFLNSHTTIQGSARTPSYTVVHDENNASMDILQSLTFSLCHHHQIVTSAISLPAPLYIANEYAKRGRALWGERMSDKDSASNGGHRETLEDIAGDLIYKPTKLGHRRINA